MSNLISTLTQPALIVWLLKATLILVAALTATSLLRRASAGTRHLVWLGTLAGILLLPALSFVTPVRWGVLPSSLTQAIAVTASPSRDGSARLAPRHTVDGAAATAASNVASLPPSAAASATVDTPTPTDRATPIWPMLLALWGVVALALLGWLTFGAISVRRIVRSGRTLDESAWTAPLCEIADRLDLDAVPRLLASSRVEMPFACGILHPTIVLPASAEEWNDSRRRAVLFHELAHVKRRDLAGHTLGRITCAFYWFHPLVWTAARRLRAESERACDDLVLSCGARASDYADHLLDIVISVRRYGAPATAMPMARRRELEGRVLAILDPAVRRIGPGRLQSLGLVSGLGVLALCVAAMAPAKRVAQGAPSAARELGTQRRETSLSVSREPNDASAKQLALRSQPQQAAAVAGAGPAATARPAMTGAPAPTAIAGVLDDSTFSGAIGAMTRVAVRAAATALSGAVNNGHPPIDSARVALLVKVLRTDADASVRRMAAWGLSEAGNASKVVEALVDAVRNDENAEVREMAAWALSDTRRESVRQALADALRKDSNDEVRETAAWALGNSQADDQRGVLETALSSDASDDVRETAAWALGYSPRRPAARALVVALGDRSADVRGTAAWALAEIEDDDTGPALIDAFTKETNGDVRSEELRALTSLRVESKAVLDAALASKSAELRAHAVRMLAGASDGSWPEPRPRPRPRPMP